MNQRAQEQQSAPGGRPSASLLKSARRFDQVYGRPARLVRFHDRLTGKKRSWGFVYETLLSRLASEVICLYEERPKLKRCVLCGAVYISNVKRANCTWTLWDAATGTEVQQCAPAEVFAAFARRESSLTHQRTRKRLNERVRRERLRAHGDDTNPRVKAALEARDGYINRSRRQPGSPQQIEPTSVELIQTSSG